MSHKCFYKYGAPQYMSLVQFPDLSQRFYKKYGGSSSPTINTKVQ